MNNNNNNLISILKNKYKINVDNVRYKVLSLRKKQGMTQRDLADKLGILQSYVSKIENGNVDFILELIYALTGVFNINPLDLLYDNNKMGVVDNKNGFEYEELKKSNEKLEAKIEVLKDVIKEIKFEYKT